jgi:hypothetical protein
VLARLIEKTMKTSLLLFALLTAACSKSKESPTSEAAKKSEAAPKATVLAPYERINETYAEVFQHGPMLPMPERIEKFLTKVAPPKRVENGTRVWFARDAAGDCWEVSLADSGMLNGDKIYDKARIEAECGP